MERETSTERPGEFRTTALVPRVGRTLVCLDRSPRSEACLPHAIHAARAFGSPITLLHVLSPSRGGAMATDALDWEIARCEAKAYLERIQQDVEASSDVPVDIRVDQGDAAERITALSRQLDAHVTVLGSHGEGDRHASELGSTAQQILSVTRGSVLVARANDDGALASARPGARIMVPLDGSARPESVLPAAVRLAKEDGAEVLLVHVVPEPRPTAVLATTADLTMARELARRLEGHAHGYLERMKRQLAGEVAKVRTLVVRASDERGELLAIASREGVDLVVLSAHGCTSDPARAFGSVTSHQLAHAKVPVLVLHDLGAHARPIADPGARELAPPPRDRFAAGRV